MWPDPNFDSLGMGEPSPKLNSRLLGDWLTAMVDGNVRLRAECWEFSHRYPLQMTQQLYTVLYLAKANYRRDINAALERYDKEIKDWLAVFKRTRQAIETQLTYEHKDNERRQLQELNDIVSWLAEFTPIETEPYRMGSGRGTRHPFEESGPQIDIFADDQISEPINEFTSRIEKNVLSWLDEHDPNARNGRLRVFDQERALLYESDLACK